MHLDMTVTLGNVIEIGGTIVALFTAYTAVKVRLAVIEAQLKPIVAWFNNGRTEHDE